MKSLQIVLLTLMVSGLSAPATAETARYRAASPDADNQPDSAMFIVKVGGKKQGHASHRDSHQGYGRGHGDGYRHPERDHRAALHRHHPKRFRHDHGYGKRWGYYGYRGYYPAPYGGYHDYRIRHEIYFGVPVGPHGYIQYRYAE